jgi:hypothetical protein
LLATMPVRYPLLATMPVRYPLLATMLTNGIK